MAESGSIAWADLTVSNASEVRDFYTAVVGWQSEDLEVGGYSDYVMRSKATGRAVTGICHAKGVNEGLPNQWLVYVNVENLQASLDKCVAMGGKVQKEPFDMGSFGKMAIITDPAGANIGLVEAAK